MKIITLASSTATAIRRGEPDANNQSAEHMKSDGNGNECRHCMRFIEKDEPMLLFAHRPFENIQAFAELGPILMHENECDRYDQTTELPEIYSAREMILRAYTADDRIIYGTGMVTPMSQFEPRVAELFEEPNVAYIHARSASNNCFHFRVER